MMTKSAIVDHPIRSVATLPVDTQLAQTLLDSVAKYSEKLQGRRIWLACSGGRDSLALAALCSQLYQQGQLPFLPQLLHIDHGLQASSYLWARHVAKWAAAQHLPCHILSVQVEGNDEQAARQARYKAMRAHINREDVILLAHHADDQAETILMRLIQGAGVKGLSGMQPWREHSQENQLTILWRPWLSVRRRHISAYAKQLKLPYIDDPTNTSGDNVRSGLRRDVIPVLATYNPNVIDNIARSVQLLTDAQATVDAQSMHDLQETVIAPLCYPAAQRVIDINRLKKLPPYRQRQLLHFWLALDEPLPPSKQLIDDSMRLTERQDHNHQTQLRWHTQGQSYTIRRYREQMYRVSQEWLSWLALPLIEPTAIDIQNMSGTTALSAELSVGLDTGMTTVTLRSNAAFDWQIKIDIERISALLKSQGSSSATKIQLQITPLDRQQKVYTTLAHLPLAGKKLYQFLGIPVWLRDSLVVVSLVHTSGIDREPSLTMSTPIMLLSPVNKWILKSDKKQVILTNRQGNDVLDNVLNEAFSNNFISKTH